MCVDLHSKHVPRNSSRFIFLAASISDNPQVPEAFSHRAQIFYLPAARGALAHGIGHLMLDFFSYPLSTLALEGERLLLLEAVRWLSGKGQHPAGPGGLCGSSHVAPLGARGFQRPHATCGTLHNTFWLLKTGNM